MQQLVYFSKRSSMQTKTLLGLFSIFSTPAMSFDIMAPNFPLRRIEPQIKSCNTAFIYAETSQLTSPEQKHSLVFQEQCSYLHELLITPSFQDNMRTHNGIIGFKDQYEFLVNIKTPKNLLVAQNEQLIRKIMSQPLINIPKFDLELLILETMLNTLTVTMAFDISKFSPSTKYVYRNGYPFEFFTTKNTQHSLENVPVMTIDDNIVGTPYLPKQWLPISASTKKILICIFQMGKEPSNDLLTFNYVVNSFVQQAHDRCKLNIDKVLINQGMPFIDRITDDNTPKILALER